MKNIPRKKRLFTNPYDPKKRKEHLCNDEAHEPVDIALMVANDNHVLVPDGFPILRRRKHANLEGLPSIL
jgi:hypothetical protein